MHTAIDLSHISADYGNRRHPVLRDINLQVRYGDFMAVTGPNGGGKTTLLRIMLKLLRPDGGRVSYFAKSGDPVKKLHVGYLPQKSAIDTRFPITVAEVIRSGLLRHMNTRLTPADSLRLQQVVELTHCTDFLHQNIGELSGGQLQRTLLARAIVSGPALLVLDEPLSYVDKRFEQQIYGIIEDLARRTTIILVSHEMSIISGMANRHIIVDHALHECHALHHYVPANDCSV